MTQYLESLNIGDTVDVRGPSGRLKYRGNGKFEIKGSGSDPPSTIMAEKLVMIAGKYASYTNSYVKYMRLKPF